VKVTAALVVVVGACGPEVIGAVQGPPPSTTTTTTTMDAGSSARSLAVLFVIDDGPDSAGVQADLAAGFPAFSSAITADAAPVLHVGVVSSSLGAGAFTDVPGCPAVSPGGLAGAGCQLSTGSFMQTAGGAPVNFTGDPAAVFGCMSRLGQGGCFVRQPLAAAQAALSANPDFVAQDVAVVIVTNGDDCSLPAMSDLFDPDPARVPVLGPLDGYRCNAFGHVCAGGVGPPIAPPPSDLTLLGCHDDPLGKLAPLAELVRFFTSDIAGVLPPGTHFAIAVLAGPIDPYVVTSISAADPTTGASTARAAVASTCAGEQDDPAVRLGDFAVATGSLFLPTCGTGRVMALAQAGQLLEVALGRVVVAH
jgi:hypothetical protein